MTEHAPLPDDLNAMEADLATRKAERDAAAHVDHLAGRLADVDLHQREARFLLERAGLLTRRRQ